MLEYEDTIFPRESEEMTRQVDHARTRLQRLLALAGSPKANIMALTGQPKIEIPRFAEQHDSDLIVLGACGPWGLWSWRPRH